METLISDNRPQYGNSQFVKFTESYRIIHVTSSPTYPRSNGQAGENSANCEEFDDHDM